MIELWIALAFGVLTLVAAVIGARGDREEREADARHEDFRHALTEREQRDAAESGRPSSADPG